MEKSANIVAGGYFASVIIHSSLIIISIRTSQGYADRCKEHICYCNDMVVVGITGATGKL